MFGFTNICNSTFEDGVSDGIGIIDGNIEFINEPQKFNIDGVK